MTAARRLVMPAVSTLAMLVVLLGLGTWQVERLMWKTALLAQVSDAETRPAIPLPATPTPFAKVRADGVLRQDLAVQYGAFVRDTPAGPVIGADRIVPLERGGDVPIMVDLGWVPTDHAPLFPLSAAPVAIEGYVRAPEHPGWLAATDDTAGRRFYTLDPAAIGVALGLARVAPFTLVALGPMPKGGVPDPAHALPRPPNDHLSYAITWYGLALVLLVIFAVYARRALAAGPDGSHGA